MLKKQSELTVKIDGHFVTYERLPYARIAKSLWLIAAAVVAGLMGFSIFVEPISSQFMLVLYCSVFYASAAFCLARAILIPVHRLVWVFYGIGWLLWAMGETYYDFFMPASNPFPSWADAGYISLYFFAVAGVVAFGRYIGDTTASWVNGLIGVLSAFTVTSALLYKPLINSLDGGTTEQIITTISYPIGGLLVLSMIGIMVGLADWKVSRAVGLAAFGFFAFWVSDTAFFIQTSNGTWVSGEWTCFGWMIGALCVAYSAWMPPTTGKILEDGELVTGLITPLVTAVGIGAFLLYGNYHSINIISQCLAALTMLLLVVRMGQVFAISNKFSKQMKIISYTDALTGLGNRRKLLRDMEASIKRIEDGGMPEVFVIFDLNGFKNYNDTFGHPAGDALLKRLAANLQKAVTQGDAYRLGGDEFCILSPQTADWEWQLELAQSALSEYGDKFHIDASYGITKLPEEANTVSEVMGFADRRMYAQKAGGRTSLGSQMRDVLLSALSERSKELGDHNDDVAVLAEKVAKKMGLSEEQTREVHRAAELHDVGKLAIPDSILFKPGPLTDDEWDTMRLHTIIGQKILAQSPAMSGVGKLVRYSHEYWDGTGYPDKIAGKDIPLGSRIVSVCDAYDAIVSDRPYKKGRTSDEAIAELKRCAGTQFDPQVVEVFVETIEEINAEEKDLENERV